MQRWRVDILQAGQWRHGWLELGEHGVAVRLEAGSEPLTPADVEAVYARSLLARIVLARHGWKVATGHERYREEDTHATA